MTSSLLKSVSFFAAVTFLVALAAPANAARPKPKKEELVSEGITIVTEEKPATSL